MEGINRKPFQGVTNIIRFNWHFYVIAATFISGLVFADQFVSPGIGTFIFYMTLLTIMSTLVSLAVSCYVYDYSNLYTLDWLNFLRINPGSRLVNINAGFDETSALLSKKYAEADLLVFDFYDPLKHTEVSIERARKAYPVFPGTINISTSSIPLSAAEVDYIFIVLAAHEIRKTEERIVFFKQLQQALKPEGKMIVLEHLRDLSNFMAYNFGFFHFFSKKEWKRTFNSAGLPIGREIKITPFISAFILQKNGTTS
jgi:hypothetical protein